jgi:hypothetical protein
MNADIKLPFYRSYYCILFVTLDFRRDSVRNIIAMVQTESVGEEVESGQVDISA